MIDVGTGVERELNISREKMNQALKILQEEGYPVYVGGIPQPTNKNQQTNQVVLCPPGTEHKEIYNYENVHSLNEYISRDGGDSFEKKFHYPESMDSSRIFVRYADDVGPDGFTGVQKDGVIELRRNVPDLSLGESHYAQVRILIDDSMYAKGMAVYSDDIPEGYDMVVNSNRKAGAPYLSTDPKVEGVFKKLKNDPENPFGSAIKDVEQGGQYWYTDENGNKKLGLINKRSDEGDWTEWQDKLPSQFLSKQSLSMAKKQLNLAVVDKQAEYDEILSINNPTIKKHFLDKFADECDAAAVNLQAAALPGQKYHVIIPVNTLKDNEIYAPGYENGTKLALIRYPHGGTFEIPIVTVNNKNELGKKWIGNQSIDAVGINSEVASRLSGADFDGDTVMCIPTHDKQGKVKVTSTEPLKGLVGFEPKKEYPYKEGMKIMKNTQTEMGIISNLINDMTLKGASTDELAAAVRHSMVVIDAEKHKLNYKQSEIDNNIAALKKAYQIKEVDEDGNPIKTGGASTLISRSKSQATVLKRQGTPKVNLKDSPDYDPTKPEGSLIYKTSDNLEYQKKKVNKKTGEITYETKYRTQASTKMAETEDARTLISDYNTPMEGVYADYANSMKQMARNARIESSKSGKIAYSSDAKKKYQNEVDSLNAKLNTALINAPKEREAIRRSNVSIAEKKKLEPDMKKDDLKKTSQKEVSKYRKEVGSVARKKRSIDITDKEWEAIQAGAISENKLTQILNNTDVDVLRQKATPRASSTLSQAKINKIKAMSDSNYTISDIANAIGCSTSTVSKYLKGEA